MPSMILRTGPLGIFTGSTYQGASDTTGIYVNCNKQDWVDRGDPDDLHKWAADNHFTIGQNPSGFEEIIGLPFTKSRSATVTGSQILDVRLIQSIEFSYQAAVDFQFNLNFSATASSQNHAGGSGSVNETESIITATVGGVSKVSITDTGVANDPDTSATYNSTLDCVASVVPVKVVLEMEATLAASTISDDTTDLTVSVSLSAA